MKIGKKSIDLTGRTFGNLTVIEETKNKNGAKAWLCECDCKKKTQLTIEAPRLTSGIKTHCGCRRQYKRHKDKVFPHEYIGKTKECVICKEQIEYIKFYFKEVVNINGETEYIFNSRCIDCDKKQATKWNKENPDKKRESVRKNGKTVKTRKYYRERQKKRTVNGTTKKYYYGNPKKFLKYTLEHNAHKTHDISNKQWVSCKEFFYYKCVFCGMTEKEHKEIFNEQLHMEHAINDGSNEIDNCIPSCKSCNSSKKKEDWIHWYTPDNPRFTQERYNKIIQWTEEEYKKYIIDKPPYKIKRKHIEGLLTYYFELWSIDEKRNIVEVLATGNKKKDLNVHIQKLFPIR